MKRINQGKLTPFYDEFGYATNIFILPSIEDIIKIVQHDYDTNQNIELENGSPEKEKKKKTSLHTHQIKNNLNIIQINKFK